MIGDKIKELLVLRGMKQIELSRRTGIPKQTINSIITRNNKGVDFSVIEKIADALEVPIEYFYDRKRDTNAEVKESPALATLTEQEAVLLNHYRGLDAYGKKLMDLVAESESERCKAEHMVRSRENQPNSIIYTPRIISMSVYDDPAAAGSPLDANSNYTRIDFPEDAIPAAADYGVRISGKSMEPTIPNGCIVFVHKTEHIKNQDIVIAWVDGEGMVCKRAVCKDGRLVCLQSDNRDYPDITGNVLNNLRIYGKVVAHTTINE